MSNANESSQQDERHFLHDVANVLTLVHGRLQLLERSLSSGSQKLTSDVIAAQVEQVLQSTERLVQMVQDRRGGL